MEKIIIETLQQELDNLQAQLKLMEGRVEQLQTTLSSLQAQCKFKETIPAEVPDEAELPTEEELPEIEVELYVDDSVVDEEDLLEGEEDLLTEEEQHQEDAVEDVIVTEIEKTVNTGVLLPPVDDIRKAISLGDRFLFQRELFQGDGEKMNKTIDTLNKMQSLDEALAYIEKKFAWDKESQAYELFTNILKRRY